MDHAGLMKRRSSLQLAQEPPSVLQQGLHLVSLGATIPCEHSMSTCVPVPLGGARSPRAAMHAAAALAVHRRRAAGGAVACPRPAARARHHRSGVADMTAAHALAPRLASAHSRSPAAPDAMSGSTPIRCACCVTLPTIARPPSCTDKFCTVIARSSLLRWRLSASTWAAKVRDSRVNARAMPSCCARSSVQASRQAQRIAAMCTDTICDTSIASMESLGAMLLIVEIMKARLASSGFCPTTLALTNCRSMPCIASRSAAPSASASSCSPTCGSGWLIAMRRL
nr:hypothetical protein BDOA9_0129210 [Bradyrhizobium sp. DOA9]